VIELQPGEIIGELLFLQRQ